MYVKLNGQIAPKRATSGSAGYDICSPSDFTIAPNQILTIDTQLAIQLKIGQYGQLVIRSSLARVGLDIMGGVIDSDFTGNIGVVLRNTGKDVVTIRKSQAFVQIITMQHCIEEVVVVDELMPTLRGAGGFGSTDAKRENYIPRGDATTSKVGFGPNVGFF